jgi:hypothetical protein
MELFKPVLLFRRVCQEHVNDYLFAYVTTLIQPRRLYIAEWYGDSVIMNC